MYSNEEAIIRRAQQGDNQAINLLIQKKIWICVYAKARYFL